MKYVFDSIEEAVKEIKRGHLVIVMDSKDREYEGDFIGAASKATPEMINFMVTHGRGAFIAVFMPSGRCDQLDIPPMGVVNRSFNQTKFRTSVDATKNTTGSSTFDRSETVRLLGNSKTKATDFVRPGHIVPIEANYKGLERRNGHTEAGVELVRLAGVEPAAAVDLEILDKNGHMAHEKELFRLAKEHKLKIISIENLKNYLTAKRNI
jgi:3,4-dihydroxy 2-butanone 4-phosphate synthase/GTP cyclohydrolase II